MKIVGSIALLLAMAACKGIPSGDPVSIEPPLTIEGYFTYMADAAVFQECLTGRRMPVAMEADYRALESAYSAAREEPGQPVYARVEGRVVERVNMEGPARPTLVVEKFMELRPGEKCPVPSQGPAVQP